MKIIRIKTSALLLAVFAVFATAQADTYPVAFSASAGGSVSSAGGQYNSGETVMCTATPAAGYRFVKWSGDVDEFHHHASTLSVTVGTNALSYSASFAPMEEGEVALDYRGMCFPSHYMKNTVLFGYARNIWDMIEFDGKIYYTYGNASNYGPGYSGNSGAVTFGLIDPLTDALSLDYTTGEEQVRSFRIGDNGNLYAPGLDACGQGGTTYLYTRAKGGAWTKRVGGANTHMCDAVEWNGYEFAANRFSTDGTSFPKITSGNGDNAYLSFSANLYYAAESMFRFVPNGASSFWADTQMKQNGKADRYDLYPGFAYHKFDNVVWPCIGFKPYRPIRYGDSVLYGAAVRHNDHQHLPVNTSLFMASENTQAASSSDPELVVRTVQIGALTNMVCYTNTMAVGTTRTRTWDFLVKEQGGRKIVLALIEQQTDRGSTTPTLMFVYASEGDLSEWREIFRFRTPEGTFARSFEYANGKFYFGLGSEADCGKGNQPDWMPVCSLNEKGASIYTGEIYSYAYDLFDAASEAPPPALPTAAFASAEQTVQENAGTVSISVVLSQASSSAVSIPFTLGGTALAGADYQIPASPLTIPAGQTSGTIDIVLAADGLAEPAETIIVVLGTPTSATLGATTTHTLTIAASEASAALAAPSYQAMLTVQGYDGAELADFPVLVRLSPQTVDGFHYGTCKADGSDVVFVDANGEPLAYQLDTWNPSGESLLWVRLPTLRPGVTFYVRWGDKESNNVVDSARSAATWNENYGAVWHMGEASGVCANSTVHGSTYDATPMGNPMSNAGQSVRYDGDDAPVGGARTTSQGGNAYLVVPNYDALQCGDTFTFSGWMRLTGGRWGNPLSRKTIPNENSGWEMMQSGNSFSKFVALGRGSRGVTGEFNPGVDTAWAHFALVYSGSTVSVYGNGALLKSDTVTAVNDNGKPLYIGNAGQADNHFVKGAFDELRLMKGAASADWVKAEHDTVAQADFLSYGASGPAWTAPSLDISGVAVVASGDSFVDLSAMLHGLGENATEASIQLAYGLDETSLVKTQGVWTVKETGPVRLRLERLLPQRVYCVQVVAVNDLDERAVSAPIRVMTAVSQDATGVAGLNQTFFTDAKKDWTKSYAELPSGTNWRDYTNDYRIYRRELGVLAAYAGGWPLDETKRKSEVWGDEVYWPVNGGQWVYWGQMRLEGGKSYHFRTHIDDWVRVQVTNPSTGITTTLLDDVKDGGAIVTSPTPFEPTETGWYPIEIRLGDGSGSAGGCTKTDDRLNTKNMGWSDDGGTTWKLMMDPGDGSLLRAGDLLAIRVDEVIANGALEKLKLTFPPAEEARDLYAAWGAQHGGATMNGWKHMQKLTTVESRCGTYEYTLPDDWGTDDKRVIRFFLDGTPRSCSSSVYWRDRSEPLITGLSLDGRGGDTLKVTGSVSFAGSPCTLKVLVGQTPEALDQEWTGLEGSGLQAPGSFDLTLFEDKTSPKYLDPGETYYVCVEATAGDSVSRSQVMKVTMAQADAIESATAEVTRRTVKFSGVLLGCGMGESESAKVSLWVGETDDAETFVQAGEEQDKQRGAFWFEHTFHDFEQTYYWQLRAVSTSAGGTVVVTTRTDVATCHTLDKTTYTWTGAADSDWGKRANWSDNQNGDSYGYPQSSAATVIFSASPKAPIVLRGEMSVGTLNLEAAGVDVTFARADEPEVEEAKPRLTVNQLKITGASLRLALDGVELYCSNDVSAFDGEVLLTNGAAWDLSSKTLYNDKGGSMWLGPGTSLTCSIYKFGGGLTVIDDATLKVRSSAVLGSNMDGGKIRFVGTHPAFLCSTRDVKVYSNRETANVRLEFALPDGGYETPPFRNADANPKYILGYYDGSQKKLHPITVDIARNSPAAIGLQKTNTTLISWGKGICPEIIKPAAKPGANAEFAWSEQTVGNNAYPVLLGVRLVPTGFIIRVR